ncbi:MAG TPA: hypothetical protein VMY37_13255 [Thermoguttaceae bacterium]|nr:hypothetical protein [Thermoguttaceae bacterium]HUW30853.1 hypothetical protein [Planctomycetota bacterium]
MLSEADKAGIRATSAEIINSTGESIVRRRYRRDPLPTGYDSDFRELAAGAPEPPHDDLALKAKIFWDVTAKRILAAYGPLEEATALVHLPAGSDVLETDLLIIRGGRFRILWIKEPPLRGFLAAPIALIPGFPMEGAFAPGVAPTTPEDAILDGGGPESGYPDGDPLDGGPA